MKKSVKTAVGKSATGKFPQATLPPMPLFQRFEMSKTLARDVHHMAHESGLPMEFLIADAIQIMVDSNDDGDNRQGARDRYIEASNDRECLKVRSLEGGVS